MIDHYIHAPLGSWSSRHNGLEQTNHEIIMIVTRFKTDQSRWEEKSHGEVRRRM